ncbi:MAG: hypothetical protein WAV21_02120 [Minisyncoccia bacterium]
MAVPPSIPTSFVPKQPVEMHPRHTESSGNMFLVVSLIAAGVALLASAGVFAYDRYLSQVRDQRAADLKTAEQSVTEDTVNGFIRLRDRLASSQILLNDHVLLSQFFDVLESLTLTGVRFTSLDLTTNSDHTAEVKMVGFAKTFNALAAQSASLATDKRIKQAIFSDISADKNGVVGFTLTAILDSRLVEISTALPATWSLETVPEDAGEVSSPTTP